MRVLWVMLVLAATGAAAQEDHSAHAKPSAPAAPKGYVPVKIEAGAIAGAQVGLATAELRPLRRSIRTYGVVTFDETRTSHVHAKVRGTLESVYATFVGKTVKAGDPLGELYSAPVYAAQLELVAVLKQGRAPGDPLVEGARRRLQLWDVPARQIERTVETQKAPRTFTLLAPRSGTLLARQAINGMYVGPDTELFVVSDLTVLWVLVDLYEADVPHVQAGTRVKLQIEGVTGELEGTVAFLPPNIDEGTRTLKARVVVDNKAGLLRPGAFVRAVIEAELGTALSVPSQAVIRTGTRNLVFVVSGEHVEPREVTLGAAGGGQVQILAGLKDGETVATTAQFLLDSESRLRATSGPAGGHAGH